MFGPHVQRDFASGPRPSLYKHIKVAQEQASECGFPMKAFQIFIGGPRKRELTIRNDEIESFVKNTKELFVVVHGAFPDFPWHGHDKAIQFIRKELKVCKKIKAKGLVIHLPALPHKYVLQNIKALLVPGSKVKIYLETPAVRPDKSYYHTPKLLAALFNQIKKIDPNGQIGLCIDTAHLWSCGINLTKRSSAQNWLDEFIALDIVSKDNLIFHLNDSDYELGNGNDKHAALTQGNIWKEYSQMPEKSGLAAFLEFAILHNIPSILERKPFDAIAEDYTIMKQISPELIL